MGKNIYKVWYKSQAFVFLISLRVILLLCMRLVKRDGFCPAISDADGMHHSPIIFTSTRFFLLPSNSP